ncbi:MAG: hypothetical protein HYW52_08790 [Gemmatimonadetes bacterium]|nr:hypothetical protein [Gemmatimonadota bacterium]
MTRPLAWLKEWLAQVWTDIRASTDTGVLAVARYFGLLYGPIDGEARIDQALRKALRYRLAGHVTWRHAFGGITSSSSSPRRRSVGWCATCTSGPPA